MRYSIISIIGFENNHRMIDLFLFYLLDLGSLPLDIDLVRTLLFLSLMEIIANGSLSFCCFLFLLNTVYCSSSWPDCTDGISLTLLRELEPLFNKYGVDMVIAGHIHSMERTHPIRYI